MKCQFCDKVFARRDGLRRHMCSAKLEGLRTSTKRANPDQIASTSSTKRPKLRRCSACDIEVPSGHYGAHLRTRQHKENSTTPYEDGIELIQQAFKCRIATYKITDTSNHSDVKAYMDVIKDKVCKQLRTALNTYKALKVNLELFGEFLLPSKNVEEVKSFNTRNKHIAQSSDLAVIYNEFVDEIDNLVSVFEQRESGWTLRNLLHLELNVNKFNPLKASSYIELPDSIKKKGAIINIQNSDLKCFMWSILAALHPVNPHRERVKFYKTFESELNFEGIEFPVKLEDVPKFEQLNNISINVYGLESVCKNGVPSIEVVGPLHFTNARKAKHINLLVVDDENGNFHYCLINNFNRLVGSQLSKHNGRKFFCDGCIAYFSSMAKLNEHQTSDCGHVRAILPTADLKIDKFGNPVPGNILKFESFEKKLKVPFVVYADFESILKPIQGCQPSDKGSFTQRTHEHIPYSFAYYIKCSYDDSLSKLETYRGFDCANIFYQRLKADVQRLYNDHLKQVVKMQPLTSEQKSNHIMALNCHICEKPFLEDEERIQDHDHLGEGLYRGPAHNPCNLNYKLHKFIPVFFHNLSNYDAHLFIKALSSDEDDSKIDVIAENKEKYISFSKSIAVDNITNNKGATERVFMKIRFLDSFRFMSSSLDSLSKTLKDEECRAIRKYYSDPVEFNLVRQKGVFPYSHVDSMERLNETELPSQMQFNNNLTKDGVSDLDYARAKSVWETFNCETLGDYSDIYLKSDVLLLADIFEAFRKVCMAAYSLDPCQYFTAPGLSWHAMLKYTGIELELLTDVEMLHFIKKGIRGGIAQCSKRKAIANNKYMPNYDSSLPTCFINYLDATNLYGAAMSQPLPVNGFDWLPESEITNFDIARVTDDSSDGYILEVDLEYPKELHDLHNDLPFCAENVVPPGSRLSKLIPNLNNKERYVIHYRNLKQCLIHGLKLVNIHRILKFKQSTWLQKYIDLNTRKRNDASSKFEKDFYKLMNNCVYGKTMENVDRRVDIRLATHWESKGKRVGAESLIAKPNFKNCSIFTKNLVAIQMEKLKVTYDKPIYIGFCVLDLSKYIIYDFYYNSIKKVFRDEVELLYSDTDSLILQTFVDDFYVHIRNNLEQYDTSNFKPDNQFGIPANKSIIGKMKDEYAGKIIWEFYGTGAKAYITNVEGQFTVDGKTTKRAKGVTSSVVKKELLMEDYKNVVENKEIVYKEMSTFRSHNHRLYTELKNKVALSGTDDKRYIVPKGDGETLAWGHYQIKDIL